MTCPDCGSSNYCPVTWEENGPYLWNIYSRCGECRMARWLTVSNEEAHAWDERLDAEQEAMNEAARDLEVLDVLTVADVLKC